jgi:molybdopterin-containing oxidoreductase family membrane subunit
MASGSPALSHPREWMRERDPLEPFPLIQGEQDNISLTRQLTRFVLERRGLGWWILFMASLGGLTLFIVAVAVTVFVGVGAWGNNIPVAWAFAITNFVWWIGIGHAGTLISAILLLLQQRWRTSINRFAEAMTLFAVMCAGLMPLLHLGRPWFFYWLFPYPSTMRVWPQFRSALVWDVFAVGTYFTVSLLFWYVGLVPDLATLRDTAKSRVKRILYGIFALGWRNSLRHWKHYRSAYLLLGGLAAPLVVSVHTVVSFDFSITLLPGWHSTIFPPYFVAGAIFSGFALVMTLIVPARWLMKNEGVITLKHLENMNKVILATSWMVAYGYVTETFIGWYGTNRYDHYVYQDRLTGAYAPVYWILMLCNVLIPQVFWSKWARTSVPIMWVVSILINVGMWSERFVIIVQSLHRDFLPSQWHLYGPTWVDWSILFGSMGLFLTLFLLFLRYVPAVPISELKELNSEMAAEGRLGAGEPEPSGL